MKGGLEDFIHQNRDAFDDKEPPRKIWKSIEASLFGRSLWNSLSLWRAAAVLFMVLSGYLLINRHDGAKVEQKDVVLNEFRDVEAFYIQQIADKVELIDEFSQSGLNGYTRDFHQLEAMYMVLKEEFKSRPSKKVKDALVLNLLVRIDLLNQQLDRLEQRLDEDEEEDQSKDTSI